MKLRDYQQEIIKKLQKSQLDCLVQLDTGAGKTPIIAQLSLLKKNKVVILVHRDILITQICQTLNEFDCKFNVIASLAVMRRCQRLKNYSTASSVRVCSVPTFVRRNWASTTPQTIIIDEAHHAIENNVWGKCLKKINNYQLIGFTATPCRLDNKSMNKAKGGLFDELIQAKKLTKESVKTLIKANILSDFEVYSTQSRLDEKALMIGRNDYTYQSLNAETQKIQYKMNGDSVKEYQRLAHGKKAIGFCVSIDCAEEAALYFREKGIAAGTLHSKQSQSLRNFMLEQYELNLIQVLFNVDVLGEGVDFPQIECLILMRKTASLGRYRQWLGRAMRGFGANKKTIIIDHVENVKKHGLPDRHIPWTLDYNEKNFFSNLIDCRGCGMTIDAFTLKCPHCGHQREPLEQAVFDRDIKYIDCQLLRIKKQEEYEQARKKAILDKRKSVILIREQSPPEKFIAVRVHQLRLTIAEVLEQEKKSILSINDFLDNDDDFFIHHFPLKEWYNTKRMITKYDDFTAPRR